MFIVHCLDLKTKKDFDKEFWDYDKYKKFINKCKYSKVIKVLSVMDNSKYYG